MGETAVKRISFFLEFLMLYEIYCEHLYTSECLNSEKNYRMFTPLLPANEIKISLSFSIFKHGSRSKMRQQIAKHYSVCLTNEAVSKQIRIKMNEILCVQGVQRIYGLFCKNKATY